MDLEEVFLLEGDRRFLSWKRKIKYFCLEIKNKFLNLVKIQELANLSNSFKYSIYSAWPYQCLLLLRNDKVSTGIHHLLYRF
jgi:hypothetical protein